MAQEIGTAYVTVQPSAKGFGKSVEGEIDQGVGGATKKADGRLRKLAKNTIKWGGAAVLGIGAAITGLAIKGGISRALNIEDAQAKLKGLGHDTKSVEAIMTDALASVRGTAYGLDTAATVAASAVASGIKPGQDLERYLRLTADAATIAGVSMDDMGGIFGKVAASNKVTLREVNQLQAQGVPILQFLADQYGVTADEMSKMVSRGEVDAAAFQKAIEENIGGAALASGDTTRGAFANMGAALSRLGLTVVQPFIDNAKGLFSELTTIIDGLDERIGPFAEKFSDWFGGKMSDSLDGFGDRFLATFDKIAGALSNFDLGGFASSIIPAIQSGIQKAADWLADGGIQAIVDSIMSGRAALFSAAMDILPALVEGFQTIFPELMDVLASLVLQVAAWLPHLAEAFLRFIPVLVDVSMDLFATLLEGLAETLPAIIIAIASMLPGIVSSLLEMAPGILTAAVEAFMALLDALTLVLPDLILRLTEDVLPQLIDALIEHGPTLLEGAITAFHALVEGLAEILPVIIDLIADVLIPTLTQSLIDNAPALLAAAFQMFMAIMEGNLRMLPIVLSGLGRVLMSLLGLVLGVVPNMLRAANRLFGGFLQGAQQKWLDIAAWVRDIPNKIKNMFSNAGNWLRDAGRRIIDGLLGGITSKFDTVRSKLSELTSKLPDWKGPADVDARLLTGNGRLIMDSLIDGFKAEEGAVRRYLQGFTGDLAMADTASVGVGANGRTGRAGNQQVRETVQLVVDRKVFGELMRTYERSLT